MISYIKEYCDRCKQYRRFRWVSVEPLMRQFIGDNLVNVYECPICGKVKVFTKEEIESRIY